MQVDWTYYGCDEHDVPVWEEHWDRVRMELEAKIAELSDVPVELRFAVDQSDANPAWEIQAALHIPGHTIVASAEGQIPAKTLEAVLRELAAGIDEVQQCTFRPIHRRQGAHNVLPLLEAWRDQDKSKAFLSFVAPFVSALGPYVDQELRLREIDGTLAGEEVDSSDVLDEVLLLSWEEFARRKDDSALELWLFQLADRVIERLGQQMAAQSLDEESAGATDDSRMMDDEAWVEHVSYPETIEIAELIPDGPGIETWDSLDIETKQTHLSTMLGQLERDQRQAFVLNVAHGFSIPEISDFQDRPVAEIESDIASATALLKRQIGDEESPDREEAYSRGDMRRKQHRSK
jgi:DNA-directed RNA polymerase specialized sigma24 family protein